jgi:hypothetical protein
LPDRQLTNQESSNVGLTSQNLSYTEERQPFFGYETKIVDKTNQVLNEKKNLIAMGAVFSPGISQHGGSDQRSTLHFPTGDIEERLDL